MMYRGSCGKHILARRIRGWEGKKAVKIDLSGKIWGSKMIVADKRDYKNGYKKHFIAYKRLAENNDDEMSRCLLLAYSVECGLKFKLLDVWKINSLGKI